MTTATIEQLTDENERLRAQVKDLQKAAENAARTGQQFAAKYLEAEAEIERLRADGRIANALYEEIQYLRAEIARLRRTAGEE